MCIVDYSSLIIIANVMKISHIQKDIKVFNSLYFILCHSVLQSFNSIYYSTSLVKAHFHSFQFVVIITSIQYIDI